MLYLYTPSFCLSAHAQTCFYLSIVYTLLIPVCTFRCLYLPFAWLCFHITCLYRFVCDTHCNWNLMICNWRYDVLLSENHHIFYCYCGCLCIPYLYLLIPSSILLSVFTPCFVVYFNLCGWCLYLELCCLFLHLECSCILIEVFIL